ncbi:MAG: metallophosphoesterase family protein [Armatimonadetes bacterium]|nr:metallophosphoesterase family protein [Armatimonadota bacterium]
MSELLTRVGIIGDPHAEDELLEKAIRFLRGEGVETLFCTGDVVTGRGDANRCCRLLMDNDVLTVRGNHDRWFFAPGYAEMFADSTPPDSIDAEAYAFLATLPLTRRFETVRGTLQLAHGTDTDDMRGVYPGDARWVLEANPPLQRLYAENVYRFLVGGHTHARMVRQFDHLTIINAGTLRRDRSPGFLLADFAAGAVQAYLFDEAGAIVPGDARPMG